MDARRIAELALEFHQAVLETLAVAGPLGYGAGRFRQMISEHGGHGTAKILLRAKPNEPHIAYGLGKLSELGILDYSMEHLALQEKWAPLFTDRDREVARNRLDALTE